MAVLAREYEDDADLRRRQGRAADCWRLEGPFVDAHVGDLPWRMYQHVDKLSEVRVRLWLDDAGRAQAWAWLWQTRAELDFQLHPESRGLLVEVLEWFESAAEPREDGGITAWALEAHEETVAALAAAGYELDEADWYEHMVASLDDELGEPQAPEGPRARGVARRVARAPRGRSRDGARLLGRRQPREQAVQVPRFRLAEPAPRLLQALAGIFG